MILPNIQVNDTVQDPSFVLLSRKYQSFRFAKSFLRRIVSTADLKIRFTLEKLNKDHDKSVFVGQMLKAFTIDNAIIMCLPLIMSATISFGFRLGHRNRFEKILPPKSKVSYQNRNRF